MKKTLRLAMAALLLSTSAAFAAPLDGQQTYDLLFRNGTLDDVNKSDALVYTRGVKNALKPDADARDSGEISLSFKTSEQNAVMAQLKLSQGERSRSLGVFPASVGNPMIMYFYESIVRDMAEAAGGSPYYIRNRVKDALIQPSEVQMGSAEFDGKTCLTKFPVGMLALSPMRPAKGLNPFTIPSCTFSGLRRHNEVSDTHRRSALRWSRSRTKCCGPA